MAGAWGPVNYSNSCSPASAVSETFLQRALWRGHAGPGVTAGEDRRRVGERPGSCTTRPPLETQMPLGEGL